MRRKKEQLDTYTHGLTVINLPASFSKPERGSICSKAQTIDDKDMYMNALIAQFKVRLSIEIRNCDKGKQDFDKLERKLLEATRLPKGIISDAEKSINAPNAITTMLRGIAQKTQTRSIDYWKDFADDNFEHLKKSVIQVEHDDNDDVNEEANKNNEEVDDESDTYDDEQEIRAFSTSLNSIIRADLSPHVKQVFTDTITIHLEQISNYISEFSTKVLEIALMFSERSFVSTDNQFELAPQSRSSITHILPDGYLQKEITVPNPLDAQLLENEESTSKYNKFFKTLI